MPSLFEAYGIEQEESAPPSTAKPSKTSTLRKIADVGISGAQGVVGGVKMLSDVFGADNAVSQSLGQVSDGLGNLLSPGRMQEMQNRARLIKEAEENGTTWDQVKANIGGFTEAPGATIAQGLGSIAPSVAAALIPGGQGVAGANLLRTVTMLGLGAGQGAGAVKGSIYEGVKRELLQAGASPEEAEARAAEAQAYSGPNKGQIGLGAGVGAVAGRLGAEGAIERIAKGVGTSPKALLPRVGGGVVTEGGTEAFQGGQERYAVNQALNNEGFEVDPFKGVAGNAALEGAVGGAIGGGLNLPAPKQVEVSPGDIIRQNLQPETGALAKAVNAGIEAQAQQADATGVLPGAELVAEPEPIDDPFRDRITALPEGPKQEALRAYAVVNNPDAPKGVLNYNRGLLDRLLRENEEARAAAEEAAAPLAPPTDTDVTGLLGPVNADPLSGALEAVKSEVAANENLANWMQRATPFPIERAQELQALAKEQRGLDMAVVPHSSGSGFTVIPAQWVTPAMRNLVGGALPFDNAPTGAIRVNTQGTAAPETRPQQLATAAENQRRTDLGLPITTRAEQGAADVSPAAPVAAVDTGLAGSANLVATGGDGVGALPADDRADGVLPVAGTPAPSSEPGVAVGTALAGNSLTNGEVDGAQADQAQQTETQRPEAPAAVEPLASITRAGGLPDSQENPVVGGIETAQEATNNIASNAPAAVEVTTPDQVANQEAPGTQGVLLSRKADTDPAKRYYKKMREILDRREEGGDPSTLDAEAAAAKAEFDAARAVAPMKLETLDSGRQVPLTVRVRNALISAKQKFAGKQVTNASDGLAIEIPASGLKHAMSGKVSEAALAALDKVDELVRTAKFSHATPDKKGRNTIKEVRFYDREAVLDGKPVNLRVVVRVAPDGRRYYDHFEIKEKAPVGLSGKRDEPDSTQPFTEASSLKSLTDSGIGALQSSRPESPPDDRGPLLFSRERRDLKDSDAFKRWFSDSKVVDAEGKPLVVYHGTGDDFDTFERGREGKKDGGWLGEGFYFTDQPEVANRYAADKQGNAKNVMPVYLSLQNPAYKTGLDAKEKLMFADLRGDKKKLAAETARLRVKGHDGIVWEPGYPDAPKEYIVFDPEQIKSATGNNGDFDPANPDIRYSRNELGQFTGKADTIRQIVQVVASRWDNPPGIEVISSLSDAPGEVIAEYERQNSQGADGEAEGFYHRGKVYLVASALNTPADVTRVLFHETLGHAGLRGVFGNALAPILDQIATLRGDLLRPVAEKYGFNLSDRGDRLKAAEEVLAFLSQTKPEIGYVKRAIAAIRTWLRANIPGFAAMKLSDAEIVNNFILPARQFVERGNKREERPQELQPAFSKSPSFDDAVDAALASAMKGETPSRAPVVVGSTPPTLQAAGIPAGPMQTSQAVLAKATFDHGVTKSVLKKIPALMASPVMVFDSDTQPGSFVVATSEFVNGKPLLVIVRPDSTRGSVTFNFVPSTYPKDNVPKIQDWLNGKLLRYIDQKQSPQWLGSARLQLPGEYRSTKGLQAASVATQESVVNDKNPSTDQTKTDAFKRWFGDSKVVDAEGKPLVVYHGTNADIAKFDSRKTADGSFWFTASPSKLEDGEAGAATSGVVIPVYLKAEKLAEWDEYERLTTDQLIQQGFDGVKLDDDYIVFRPEQIKSAIGNNGVFDPDNADIRFSRTTAITPKAALDEAMTRTGGALANRLDLALNLLTRRQIVDVYDKDIPQLKTYSTLVQQMDADKNEVGAQADQLADRWGKLRDEKPLAELMHDATLARTDPGLPFVERAEEKPLERRARLVEHKALTDRFNALSNDAKAVYRETRDAYRVQYDNIKQAIRENIERAIKDEPTRLKFLDRLDTEFFKDIQGVYFPLARFGDYLVNVRDADGGLISHHRAETLNEANHLRAQLVEQGKTLGWDVGKVLKSKEFNARRDLAGKGFIKEIMDTLKTSGVDGNVINSVAQLYLQSLPDLSWAKHGIHRKGTAGFSQDARRAFASNMFFGARYLAKLRYNDKLLDSLATMQEQVDSGVYNDGYDSVAAQKVVDHMNKRHDSLMNPDTNPVSTALTSIGFIFHLGLSPASAMVNLSQTALVAYPIMGAKWGYAKASAALLSASKLVTVSKNDLSNALTGDEKAAYEQAVKDGTIDVTQAHDLAGIAQGEDSKVAWKIRPVMKWASFLFHHAERFNRQVTFVASYRLAREAGTAHEQAVEEATKATIDGHFDYSASNRAKAMQGNVARVVLLFKQYAQNMIYTLSRQAFLAMKGQTPEERTEARKALGGLLAMHAAAAGGLGLPIVSSLLAAASFLGGDDDEPWNAEVALKNTLADTFGPKAAEVMAHGLSRLTPWDISGRVGLDKLLFPDIQEGLDGGRWFESAATAALGPVVGIGLNALKGLQDVSEGRTVRGLEGMMPTALRGPLKAYRYATEGNVDRTGVVINDEVSLSGIAGQAAGFSPSETRAAQEVRSAIYSHDNALVERRKSLMSQYAAAKMAGDEEGAQEVREMINGFNEKNPARRIKPMQLVQSVRRRQQRIDSAEEGVYLPKNRRDAISAVRFGEEVTAE